MTLTKRQQEIYFYIEHCILTSLPPTYRQIADAFGFAVNSARMHVMALKGKGYLAGDDIVSRGIQLAKPAVAIINGQVFTAGGPTVEMVNEAISKAKGSK